MKISISRRTHDLRLLSFGETIREAYIRIPKYLFLIERPASEATTLTLTKAINNYDLRSAFKVEIIFQCRIDNISRTSTSKKIVFFFVFSIRTPRTKSSRRCLRNEFKVMMWREMARRKPRRDQFVVSFLINKWRSLQLVLFFFWFQRFKYI